MTRTAAAGAFALVLACSTLSAGPAAAQTPPELKNDMIEVEYNAPKSEKYRPIYERMKERKVLERWAKARGIDLL